MRQVTSPDPFPEDRKLRPRLTLARLFVQLTRVCPQNAGHSIGAARIAVDSVDTLTFGLRGGDDLCLVRGGLVPARREGVLIGPFRTAEYESSTSHDASRSGEVGCDRLRLGVC